MYQSGAWWKKIFRGQPVEQKVAYCRWGEGKPRLQGYCLVWLSQASLINSPFCNTQSWWFFQHFSPSCALHNPHTIFFHPCVPSLLVQRPVLFGSGGMPPSFNCKVEEAFWMQAVCLTPVRHSSFKTPFGSFNDILLNRLLDAERWWHLQSCFWNVDTQQFRYLYLLLSPSPQRGKCQ